MEIVFLLSWIIGIMFSILFTGIAWTTKDKDAWSTVPFVWTGMILTGWVTGLAVFFLIIYVALSKRFEE